MPTERDKMLAGQLYDPLNPELDRARERARDLCQALNATSFGSDHIASNGRKAMRRMPSVLVQGSGQNGHRRPALVIHFGCQGDDPAVPCSSPVR